jgi:hypothetical protein
MADITLDPDDPAVWAATQNDASLLNKEPAATMPHVSFFFPLASPFLNGFKSYPPDDNVFFSLLILTSQVRIEFAISRHWPAATAASRRPIFIHHRTHICVDLSLPVRPAGTVVVVTIVSSEHPSAGRGPRAF